jgi:hypothetical protein
VIHFRAEKMTKKRGVTAEDLLNISDQKATYSYIPLVYQAPTKPEEEKRNELETDVRKLFTLLNRNGIVNCAVDEFQSHFFDDIKTKKKIVWRSTPTSLMYFFTYLNAYGIFPDPDFVEIRKVLNKHFLNKNRKEFNEYSMRTVKTRLTSNRTKESIRYDAPSSQNRIIKEIIDQVFIL